MVLGCHLTAPLRPGSGTAVVSAVPTSDTPSFLEATFLFGASLFWALLHLLLHRGLRTNLTPASGSSQPAVSAVSDVTATSGWRSRVDRVSESFDSMISR